VRPRKNTYDCLRMGRLGEYVLSHNIPLSVIAGRMAEELNGKGQGVDPKALTFSVLLQHIRTGKIASTSTENLELLATAVSREGGKSRKEILADILEILRYAPDERGEYRRYGHMWHGVGQIRHTGARDIAIDLAELYQAKPSGDVLDKTEKALEKFMKDDIIEKLPYARLVRAIGKALEGMDRDVHKPRQKFEYDDHRQKQARRLFTNTSVMSCLIVAIYLQTRHENKRP